MTVPGWAWAATLTVMCLLIAADLLLSRGGGHCDEGLVDRRRACLRRVLFLWQGPSIAGQYFADYLLEKALSVDNIFGFVLLSGSLAVPAALQRRVLYLEVLGVLVLRGGFIAASGALIDHFSWISGGKPAIWPASRQPPAASRASQSDCDNSEAPSPAV